MVSSLYYLESMTVEEYGIILEEKWFRTEVNSAKQLVREKGAAVLIPLAGLLLVNSEQTFSFIGESVGHW